MTNPAILEALANVIMNTPGDPHSYGPTVHDARAIAAAVLELVGPRPLVWGMVHHRGTDFIEARSSITGTYSLRCTERGYTIIWLNERPLHPVVHGAHFSYGTLEAAQAAAQAHADAAHWANTALGAMIGGE